MDTVERLLNKIDGKYDKTLGSFAFDFSKTVSLEIDKIYEELKRVRDLGFADTSKGSDLDRICYEMGVIRHKAQAAKGIITVSGTVGTKIPKNSAFGSDQMVFLSQKEEILDISPKDIEVVCQTPGASGNVPVGAIKYYPKTIQGLVSVTNKTTFKNGYDEESDDALRERYYIAVRTPATSGNVYHYINWAREVDGVGAAKIYPLADGPGTVTVRIINSNKTGASAELIEKVKSHIESVRPIGATVKLISADELVLNVNLSIVIKQGISLTAAKENIRNSIAGFLGSIAFSAKTVSYARLLNAVFEATGVEDVNNMTVNGGKTNIPVSDIQVAVLGVINYAQ